MAGKKKKNKYSLSQRIDYYNRIAESEYKKNGNKVSNKERYAYGYIQGATKGLSLNYDSLDKYSKLGQKAGVRASEKSRNIKF